MKDEFFKKFPVGAFVRGNFEGRELNGRIDFIFRDKDGKRGFNVLQVFNPSDVRSVRVMEPADGFTAYRICERASCAREIGVDERRCEEHRQEFDRNCDAYRRMMSNPNVSRDDINAFRAGKIKE